MITGPLLCLREIKSGISIVKKTIRIIYLQRLIVRIYKMTIGLVGQKCGMTRIFTEDGVSIPVTVIEAMPNRITQVKTSERDGYNAVQVTSGSKKPERVNKSMAGHFAAANVEAGNLNNEFRIEENDEVIFEVGSELKVDVFQEGQIVDVIGKSIGKGFAGTVKAS